MSVDKEEEREFQRVAKQVKFYIDSDVLTEAKKRIKHIIETFDTVVVCFSGGKDSLATLHLTQEVYDEMGRKDKVKVLFRDEELIPDDVIDFVTSYYKSGKYEFYYFAVPLFSNKFILGKTETYVQWDKNRKWLRPKPEFAIVLPEGDDRVFDQYSMDKFAAERFKGKIAFLTGIRADESLVRLRACINKKNENYINATDTPNVKLCKPIFDWTEKDVFKFFYDRGIKYCEIYDMQTINGDGYRVATPLHAESAKRFDKLRTLYPTYYQQLVDIFPEMIVQEKYWKDLDRYGIIYRYDHSWSGIVRYIKENIDDPHQQKLAIERVLQCKSIRENKLAKGEGTHNFGGYPILFVFKCIVNGQFKRVITPCNKPTKADYEYEQGEQT